jgi:hypothetical protein
MLKHLRRTAYLAVFGAVWGGAEMLLGGFLHALHIPMKGLIMSTVAAFLLISARLWIGGKGTAITMGVIAAFLKLFSIGGLVLSPAIAIIMESLLAECCFLLAGENLFACLITGAAIVTYCILHKILALILIYHSEISDFYRSFSSENSLFTRLGVSSLTVIICIYVLLHLIVGILAGILSYVSVYRARSRSKM